MSANGSIYFIIAGVEHPASSDEEKSCNQEKKFWKAFNAPKSIEGKLPGKPFASSSSSLLSDSHNI